MSLVDTFVFPGEGATSWFFLCFLLEDGFGVWTVGFALEGARGVLWGSGDILVDGLLFEEGVV